MVFLSFRCRRSFGYIFSPHSFICCKTALEPNPKQTPGSVHSQVVLNSLCVANGKQMSQWPVTVQSYSEYSRLEGFTFARNVFPSPIAKSLVTKNFLCEQKLVSVAVPWHNTTTPQALPLYAQVVRIFSPKPGLSHATKDLDLHTQYHKCDQCDSLQSGVRKREDCLKHFRKEKKQEFDVTSVHAEIASVKKMIKKSLATSMKERPQHLIQNLFLMQFSKLLLHWNSCFPAFSLFVQTYLGKFAGLN